MTPFSIATPSGVLHSSQGTQVQSLERELRCPRTAPGVTNEALEGRSQGNVPGFRIDDRPHPSNALKNRTIFGSLNNSRASCLPACHPLISLMVISTPSAFGSNVLTLPARTPASGRSAQGSHQSKSVQCVNQNA